MTAISTKHTLIILAAGHAGCVRFYKNLAVKSKINRAFGINERYLTYLRRFAAGPPGGIRTPVLQNRNLLRYPASLRADDAGVRGQVGGDRPESLRRVF